ncbi:MAG TPA: arsenate reductase ArsC [Candidatus Limnocylindrales bacterium]
MAPNSIPADDERVRVLFLCTGNSARSQIAEALLEASGGTSFDVESAGIDPHGVNPLTVRVLADDGIDWSGARSKGIGEFLGQDFDFVVTVCDRAREACPTFPGARRMLHWDLDDPADAQGTDEVRLAAFRRTKDEVTRRLPSLIEAARRLPAVS